MEQVAAVTGRSAEHRAPVQRAAQVGLRAGLMLAVSLMALSVEAQQRPRNPPPPAPVPVAPVPVAPAPVTPTPVTPAVPVAAVPTIPAFFQALTDHTNAAGTASTLLSGGAVTTAANAFFQTLGSNGRTCATCHEPSTGWSITPAFAAALLTQSNGTAALFRTVDAATCSTANVSTANARQQAYTLLLSKGLIRVGITLPSTPFEFSIQNVNDPYNCTINPATGLTAFGPATQPAGIVSVYRRPLPSANLKFNAELMWDGREASLTTQADHATLGHAQAAASPTATQLAQVVGFEQGVFAAQVTTTAAGRLDQGGGLGGGLGGPAFLSTMAFTPGANDISSPTHDRASMTLFDAWNTAAGAGPGAVGTARQQIARGARLFETRPINVAGVRGLNDTLNRPVITTTCSGCHNVPNVGNRAIAGAMDIGVSAQAARGLNTTGLPVFTIRCEGGTLRNSVFTVTDPGVALLTGRCADVARFKVPGLRNLAARAPYFHNGSAASLEDVIDFYNGRFNAGLNAQDRADMAAFLRAL
jgi:cytochrome c peroxidase